ncbi:helix-turn-helix transcriptional regulator [Paenibacillus sp. MWE-103]|uniref:Helix-turn-helix transcriptional regulator n=1 Tax=Paenibacillus artemisiicola TaxID=1172618 RepID=A0ABS3WJT8_9BACL|nr:helix-turn-helix transcriptional regulator [Paenibacillus artemisiicola]MBO7748572.1 helix-turn-helix transcriptional regulator [Paenibacillus artemisiicola]
MNDWDNSGGRSDRGILKADLARQKFALRRIDPSPALAPYIEHYWIVRWDLRGQPPYSQTVLSYPSVNIAFEREGGGRFAGVYGVPTRTFVRSLREEGDVLGIKFRPGGFYPFWRRPAALLTGRAVPWTELFGEAARDAEARLFAADADEERVRLAEAFFGSRLPGPDDDEAVRLVGDIVREVIGNRELAKVEDLVERFALNKRALQRLFGRYVGVSPKWIIQRYRLQEAAERIERERGAPDWPRLAQDLGFYDQAHFIKSFKALIGKSPEEYGRELGLP